MASRRSSRGKSPGKAKPAGLTDESFRTFLRTRGPGWLHDPNIVGLGLGEKESGGKGTGTVAIRFVVVGKLADRAELIRAGTRPIPPTIEIDGVDVPTDVEEGWPEAHALAPADPKTRHDPVCGGISIGSSTDTGTLGAVLWHRPTGQLVALSNYHVLANDSQSKSVFQPGPGDLAGPGFLVGAWCDRALDINLDAAVSTIQGRGALAKISGLGVEVTAVAAPQLNSRVVKSGKETGLTYGRIIEVDALTSYRVFGLPERHKIMVFVIKPDGPAPSALSKHGDSGSCWMLADDNGRPTGTMVGLHVAGDEGRRLAYACRADKLFERFGLEPAGPRVGATPAAKLLVAAEMAPGRQRVIARDGLLLRGGPGTEFPKRGSLPFGTEVNAIARAGDWLAVDLQGDGKADGFMHASLLAPVGTD